MRDRWAIAVAASFGRWLFEYLALVLVLVAVGASPDPLLVLFAFVAASVLTWVPLTPGGVGFVEAGLTGTLVLAGVPAPTAVLATLVFRLFSFWLPLPVGAVAAVAFRRRYPVMRASAVAVPALVPVPAFAGAADGPVADLAPLHMARAVPVDVVDRPDATEGPDDAQSTRCNPLRSLCAGSPPNAASSTVVST